MRAMQLGNEPEGGGLPVSRDCVAEILSELVHLAFLPPPSRNGQLWFRRPRGPQRVSRGAAPCSPVVLCRKGGLE